MNIFSRFRAFVDGLFWDKRLWHTVGGSRSTTAKVDVSEDSALNYSAVWCATRLICGTCSNFSLPVYRSGADGESRTKIKHLVSRILNVEPNPEMTAFNFRSIMWQWQVNWGNAYAEIVREGNNPEAPLKALWPLHPAIVTPMRDDNGVLYYEVSRGAGDKVELEAWQMLHLPSIVTYDGIVGQGVIQHARESIGAGLAAEKKAANNFGSGGIPSMVVEHARKWNDESRNAFRKEWKEIHGGPDGDTVALLTDGAVAKPLQGLSERDNQFLETRQFSVEEIARWYGIPPHLLHHLLRATFNNIEELGIDFVRYCLLPWLEIWHQGIRQKLFTPDEQDDLFVEHNVDELMDGNAQSRAQLYQVLVLSGIMTRNECRRRENLDPVPGGDTYLVQGAMVPLDEEGKPESEFAGVGGGDAGATDTLTGDAAASAAVGTDVQATALNGAQISSLVLIADRMILGDVNEDAGRAMFRASFPSMDHGLIDTMVAELAERAKEKPPVPTVQQVPSQQKNLPAPSAATAIEHVIERDLTRLLTKETNEMTRQSKNSSNFVGKVEEFYTAHRTLLVDAVHATTTALNSCGYEIDASALASTWVSEGKSMILEASGTATNGIELTEAVKQVIESKTWTERPSRAVERAKHASVT